MRRDQTTRRFDEGKTVRVTRLYCGSASLASDCCSAVHGRMRSRPGCALIASHCAGHQRLLLPSFRFGLGRARDRIAVERLTGAPVPGRTHPASVSLQRRRSKPNKRRALWRAASRSAKSLDEAYRDGLAFRARDCGRSSNSGKMTCRTADTPWAPASPGVQSASSQISFCVGSAHPMGGLCFDLTPTRRFISVMASRVATSFMRDLWRFWAYPCRSFSG